MREISYIALHRKIDGRGKACKNFKTCKGIVELKSQYHYKKKFVPDSMLR